MASDPAALRVVVNSILDEGERLATEAFRQYLLQMEEVVRMDYGEEEAAKVCASALKILSRTAQVRLRNSLRARFAIWLTTLGNPSGESILREQV